MRALLMAAAWLTTSAGVLWAQEIKSSTTSSVTSEMAGRKHGAMLLKRTSTDPGYATSEKQPVMVGGGPGQGIRNTYRFLNALQGPRGEPVHYERVGACCVFKTKNAAIGDRGLLDVYNVWYDGHQPVRLYINWYDDGDVLVPVGFTAVQ